MRTRCCRRLLFPGTMLMVTMAAGASVMTMISACASSPRRTGVKPITPVSITEGDGVALGSQIELTMDQDPTVVHEVIDFRIADSSIVSGTIVPSQGLVLIAKKNGETTADLRTADGVVRTIAIIVRPASPGETVFDVTAGEIFSLGEDEITEWAASPPGSAVVAPSTNSRGFSVVANEAGEVLLLLRSNSGVRLVHLYVHSASIGTSRLDAGGALTPIVDGEDADATKLRAKPARPML